MTYTIHADDLENLASYWKEAGNNLVWPFVFVLPPWLEAWWHVFGKGLETCIRTVRLDGTIVGIAPLKKTGDSVSFIGDVDVCDYSDFIVAPGHEEAFFDVLLDDLVKHAIGRLDLKHVRPGSLVLDKLVPVAQKRGFKIDTVQADVSVEMDLPSGWDAYLESLSSKQRHELRRKLRRLQEAGNLEFRFIDDASSVPGLMDVFFKMFADSRSDKAAFLTEKMESFFRLLADNMAGAGLLKLGVLDLDGKPVAQIICFDYNDCIYLYNSGYNPDYVSLSAGLLSKTLAIKDSIEKAKHTFDFLKGAENYKYHLGGREVPLFHCLVDLK